MAAFRVRLAIKNQRKSYFPLIKRYSSIGKPLREILLNVPETKVTTLSNGLQVASENNGMQTCTVGLWINAGSRYETEKTNGVAHFLEHMIFKGTERRSQSGLELEIENMGAHLNAYTSREQTVYYAKSLSKDMPQMVDILSDILLNSKLSEDEIERERGVILREVQEIETMPHEVLLDHLHTVAYQGTPLCRTILGPTDNIQSITRHDLVNYITDHYHPNRMVLAAAGGVDHDQLCELAEKHFGKMASQVENAAERATPCRFTGGEMRDRDDNMPFVHIALAVETPGWPNVDTIPLMVAATLMGNWDRSVGSGADNPNPLAVYMHKTGEAHSYNTFCTLYNDTGLWGVQMVLAWQAEKSQWDVMQETQRQMIRIATMASETEVSRAKNLFRRNMLQSLDGTTATCEDIGRQMLCYGRRIPLQEMDARIEKVTAESLKQLQRVQNWASRVITRRRKYEHMSDAIETLGRLDVSEHAELAVPAYNAQQRYLGRDLQASSPRWHILPRGLREADPLVQRLALTNRGHQRFGMAGPRILNR